MAYKVLIPQDIAEEGKQYLRERGYEVKMGSGVTVEEIAADVVDCDAILARTAPFPAEVLEGGEQLKVIARHGVGVDNIDVEKATELGIQVTNAVESNSNTVAELCIGFIIALGRNLVQCDRATRAGDFEFRNRVKGVDFPEHVQPVDAWDELFATSDYVTIHIPSTPKTKRSIGMREFKLMKPTGYFINAARGDVVVEEELVAALKEGIIAGAGLDVFEQEPPPADHPLFALDNVVLTPHNAALTHECMIRMALHAAQGIDEVLSGRSPTWPINKLS